MTAALAASLGAIAVLLGLASVLLFRWFGVSGRVVASDSIVARRTAIMRSAEFGISGKPDYLVEERGRVVPVEIKPLRRSARPWLRDVVQLSAYCLLLEECEPRFAGYGYLRYANRTFRIDFTDSLREELLRTADALRADIVAADVDRDHDDPGRCARCSLRAACGQALGSRS